MKLNRITTPELTINNSTKNPAINKAVLTLASLVALQISACCNKTTTNENSKTNLSTESNENIAPEYKALHEAFNNYCQEILKATEDIEDENAKTNIKAVVEYYQSIMSSRSNESLKFIIDKELDDGTGHHYIPSKQELHLPADFNPKNKLDLLTLFHELSHAYNDNKMRKELGATGYKERVYKERDLGVNLADEAGTLYMHVLLFNALNDGEVKLLRERMVAASNNLEKFRSEGQNMLDETIDKILMNMNARQDQAEFVEILLQYSFRIFANNPPKADRQFVDVVINKYAIAKQKMFEYTQLDPENPEILIISNGIPASTTDSNLVVVHLPNGDKQVIDITE